MSPTQNDALTFFDALHENIVERLKEHMDQSDLRFSGVVGQIHLAIVREMPLADLTGRVGELCARMSRS